MQREVAWKESLVCQTNTLLSCSTSPTNVNDSVSNLNISTIPVCSEVPFSSFISTNTTSNTDIATIHSTLHPLSNFAFISDEFTLNFEQQCAFGLIVDHMESVTTLPQLRLCIDGHSGTGKSHIIDAISNHFLKRNESYHLRLTAPTGTAAHNISGLTLHSALKIGLNKTRKAKEDLITMWQSVDYLFIDEVSMIGCNLLYAIHEALCIVKENNQPFGGVNIIFAGDFAQLPPVRETHLCS